MTTTIETAEERQPLTPLDCRTCPRSTAGTMCESVASVIVASATHLGVDRYRLPLHVRANLALGSMVAGVSAKIVGDEACVSYRTNPTESEQS